MGIRRRRRRSVIAAVSICILNNYVYCASHELECLCLAVALPYDMLYVPILLNLSTIYCTYVALYALAV